MRRVETAGRALGFKTDAQWAAEQAAGLPDSWVRVLLRQRAQGSRGDRRTANLGHIAACRNIAKAMRAGVPADSDDAALRQAAHVSALDAERRFATVDIVARGIEAPYRWWVSEEQHRERMSMLAKVFEATTWLAHHGLEDGFLQRCRVGIRGALRRVACERWWRRVLRKLHAQAIEGTARSLGLVHKRAGCYVSDESLKRRRGQRAQNAAALESVKAVNEHGQDYTLAELAAKGVANREIRRHELMTRIAGFELIAKECNHHALFVTVTCPSRMHAWRTRSDRHGVEQNPKHDGTKPDEAQRYLTRQWAAFRSACDRWGVECYGFRIAEPNHDGTPHWHALLFIPPSVGAGTVRFNPRAGRACADRVALRLLRRYFLWNSDARERGAKAHRVKVERIDWTRGSAAGYVAKYVAKNIDGYRVEKDLYGNDAITSSQRVEAWAATWRIRQFQQLGGAPVGVWRELRRLHPEAESACAAVGMALDAVNAGSKAPDDAGEAVQSYTAATGWAAYLHLQGGHRVKRAALRLGLLREQTGEIGRYGECMPARAVGVVTRDERREVVPAFGIVPASTRRRAVLVEVESERATWIVVPKGFVEQVKARMGTPSEGEEAGSYPRQAGNGMGAGAAGVRPPWSPVNNCTRPEDLAAAAWFAPSVERVKKRGRWHQWKPNGGVRTEESPHDPPERRHPDPDRSPEGGGG